MKCFYLIILILIFNQINGHQIYCGSKSSLSCTVEDVNNSSQLNQLMHETLKFNTIANKLNFENSSLDFLPLKIFTIFTYLTTLDASGLQLQSIGEQQFKSAHQLENLSLSNNNLTMFNTSLLSESKDLKTFDISINGIEFLDFKVLQENNINLNEFNISHNKMTHVVISENIVTFDASNNLLEHFEISMESQLKYLNLSANKLSNEDKKYLNNLRLIEHLNIGDMMLEPLEIDLFVEMENLRSLILRNTGISKIEFGTFSNLKDLQVLDLSDNKITELDVNMLTVLNNLKSLSINGNQIVTINLFKKESQIILPNLKELNLEGNNWECSFLAQLYQSLTSNRVEVVKLIHPKKNSTNVMFIECHHQQVITTTTTTTTEVHEEPSTIPEEPTTYPESNQFKTHIIEYRYVDSSFYKILASISLTLLVVAILLKLKKYVKFNYCQSHKLVDEKELRPITTTTTEAV